MPVNEVVVDNITIDNLKTVAGQPAALMNLALANAVAASQEMGAISRAATAKAIKLLLEYDIEQATGETPVLHALGKIVGTQPPVTVSSPA